MLTVGRESSVFVVHNRHEIVRGRDEIDAAGVFLEVVVIARVNWGQIDDDMVVTIRSRLFVEEAERVHELMGDDHIVQTTVVERDLLSTRRSLFANVRVATTASLRNVDVVRLVGSLNERDAILAVHSGLVLNGFHARSDNVLFIGTYKLGF